MATREEVIMALRHKGYNGPIPGEQNQAQTPQQTPTLPNVQDLMKKSQPPVGESIANAMSVLGGGKPVYDQSSNPYQKYMDTILREQAKALYRDPQEVAYKNKQMENMQSQIEGRKAGLEFDSEGNIIGRKSDTARTEREDRLHDFETRRTGTTLRGELIANPDIKRFSERRQAASGIDAILQDAISRPDLKSKNVSDQALITLYNKILDPLSVVRESEYERTPEGQSLLNRIRGFYEKVQAGGSGLTDADRIEVARAAKILLNKQGEIYNQHLGRYKELSGAYGVPENLVMTGFEQFTPYEIDQFQSQIVPTTQGTQSPIVDPQIESRKQALRAKYANR